jgi:hypothetical protein
MIVRLNSALVANELRIGNCVNSVFEVGVHDMPSSSHSYIHRQLSESLTTAKVSLPKRMDKMKQLHQISGHQDINII